MASAPSLGALQGAPRDVSSSATTPSQSLRCTFTRALVPSERSSCGRALSSCRQQAQVLSRGASLRRALAFRASSAADGAASTEAARVIDTELIPPNSETEGSAITSAAFSEGDVRALPGLAEAQGSASLSTSYDSPEALSATGSGSSRPAEAGNRGAEAGWREAGTESETTPLGTASLNGKAEGSASGSGHDSGGESEEGGGREKEGEREEEGDSGKEGESEEEGDEEVEPGYKMSRVCDRLIDVFWVEKPTPEDWRKLLAYSEEWSRIRPHFFRRCEARAKDLEAEDKPGKAAELYRLARRLKEVDDAMCRHAELFDLIQENEEELDGIVGRRRQDFTGEFFEYVRIKCEASYKDLSKQEDLVQLASKILNSVAQHDKLMENEAQVEAAQAKFDDIMSSGTLEEACNKIDSLADRQQLDSTLMLMITKAWAAAKESNMMKDEVKDVMYHLYMQALGNMRMLVPKEVRILRHVLSLEDPRETMAALTAAFSPGTELEVQNASEDYLYTTPDKLLEVVDQVLTAFYNNKETTLIEEAKKLMNPAVIKKLEILKKVIIDEFK